MCATKQSLVETINQIQEEQHMNEVKINLEDAFKQNMSDGNSCAAAEPFALRTIDDSMEPEFAIPPP